MNISHPLKFSTPNRYEELKKQQTSNKTFVNQNFSEKDIQSAAKYKLSQQNLNQYYVETRANSRRKADKQNLSNALIAPNHLNLNNKLDVSPTIKLNNTEYSPISEKQHEGDSVIEEIGSRLQNNLQVIDTVTKSRLQRSKSRRKDMMWLESRQKKPGIENKNEIIEKINMKLKSVQKIKAEFPQKQDITDEYNEDNYQVNRSLKRSLKPDFLGMEIPTTQSILKIELSQCQNLLSSIKKRELQNIEILKKIQLKKAEEEKRKVRDVQSYEIEGSAVSINPIKNKESKISEYINEKKQKSSQFRDIYVKYYVEQTQNKRINIETDYDQYKGYKYPKYINPNKNPTHLPQSLAYINLLSEKNNYLPNTFTSSHNEQQNINQNIQQHNFSKMILENRRNLETSHFKFQ